MTDQELTEKLTEIAHALCGGFNNSHHKAAEVRRLIQMLETVDPVTYASMYFALLPGRDRDFRSLSMWEAATGQKTLGM
jgi:hypothetical protein